MKLPPPEVSNNVVQWLRGATGAKCVLKHFKSDGQKYFAIFNCTVCRDEFKQAADTLSDGIPVKLQEWATKHAHQPPAIEDVLATVFEPGNFKKKAEAPKSEPAKPPEPKPLPVLVQHKGRKFRE